MGETSTDRSLFHDSLERCICSDRFIPAFYERFTSSSDEVKLRFVRTNFEKQNEMLKRSLSLIEAATEGKPEGLRELNERAETHDRYHLKIKPELYELWRSAVLETAREFDSQWDDEIENAWQHILDFAIAYMVRRY